jgi:putative copper export protein
LVLDQAVLPIDINVIRMTLHILAATIWVGAMIVLGALAGPLRRAAPEALAPAASPSPGWAGPRSR